MTPGSSGLVELDHPRDVGQSTAELDQQLGDPLGQGLAELTSGARIGQHPVASWPFHRGGQRPRTGDRQLQLADIALGLLLELVQIGAEHGPSLPVLPAGRVAEPPARGLQVDRQVVQQGGRPADQLRPWSAGRELGQIGQLGALGEGDLERLGDVGAGPGADATAADRRRVAHGRRVPHRVLAIVELPTTRVPSYSTAAWPGATPVSATPSEMPPRRRRP